jgi:serine/threonine protein kinase
MHVSQLCQRDLQQLTNNAAILEADGLGPKVLRLENGQILKMFRRKRWLSSALLRPYSRRFINNAERLQSLGIATLDVHALYELPDKSVSAVLYAPLPGMSLTELGQDPDFSWASILPELITFVRDLHRKGIYFRSLHLGNIILTPQGSLGLIDIADMRFLGKPLPNHMIRRNLAHFSRYLDREQFQNSFPFIQFYDALIDPEPPVSSSS